MLPYLLRFIYHYLLGVGRVPGNYPVPVGYCTTRHYPDPVGHYFRMWPDPGYLTRFLRLSTIPHAVKREVGICLVTIFDARHSGVTRDRYLFNLQYTSSIKYTALFSRHDS